MDQLERRLYLIRELLCENPGYGDIGDILGKLIGKA